MSYFEGQTHVLTYNKFRPSPPGNLIERIVKFASEEIQEPLELAVDVGCGSGQSTEVLAPYFKKILGVDCSEDIITEARKKCCLPNVVYSASPAECMKVDSNSADVVTVCQALHWLDIPKFYAEAERILKPKGVIGVYGYNLPELMCDDCQEVSTIVKKYYQEVLGDYTLPQSREAYLNNYRSKEFNEVQFIEGEKMKREDNFILDIQGNISDIIGYMTSMSAFQNFTKHEGEEKGRQVLKKFEEEFKSAIRHSENLDKPFTIRFNYFLLLGRKK